MAWRQMDWQAIEAARLQEIRDKMAAQAAARRLPDSPIVRGQRVARPYGYFLSDWPIEDQAEMEEVTEAIREEFRAKHGDVVFDGDEDEDEDEDVICDEDE